MAWVVSVDKKDGSGRVQPTQVVAFVKVFETPDGLPILQVDSMGSSDREKPGKQSQTLQFGREAAEQLYQVLQDTFGFKR
jgi:hypothetical protein